VSNSGKYLANTSWLFCEKSAQILSVILIDILVARYLQPEQYGRLCYVRSFASFSLGVATFGINGVLVKELVEFPSKKNHIMGTAAILRVCSSIVVVLANLALLDILNKDAELSHMIIIVCVSSFFQGTQIIDSYFQSIVLSKYVVMVRICGLAISGIVKILLITNGFPLVYFAWVILLENFCYGVGLIIAFCKNGNEIKTWRFNGRWARKLFFEGLPLVFTGVLITIYMKIDQVMLQEMVGSSAVGMYSAAAMISEGWYFLPIIITSSLFPAIVSAKQESSRVYLQRMQKLYDFITATSICCAVLISIFGTGVIEKLYGEAYLDSASVLIIHIWGGVAVSQGLVRGKWVLCEKLQKYDFFVHLFGAITNVILNLILIPRFGIQGAAFATLTSNNLAIFLSPLARREFRIPVRMILKSNVRILSFGLFDILMHKASFLTKKTKLS
jgi:O-antigen/teichoic acid export membrane protein